MQHFSVIGRYVFIGSGLSKKPTNFLYNPNGNYIDNLALGFVDVAPGNKDHDNFVIKHYIKCDNSLQNDPQ